MRIRFIKDTRNYKKGDVVNINPPLAYSYIASGKAIKTKDMTNEDIRIKRG